MADRLYRPYLPRQRMLTKANADSVGAVKPTLIERTVTPL